MKLNDLYHKLKFTGKYATLLNATVSLCMLITVAGSIYLISKGASGPVGMFIILVGLFILLLVYTFVLLHLYANAIDTTPTVDVKESLKELIIHADHYALTENQLKNAKKLLRKVSAEQQYGNYY